MKTQIHFKRHFDEILAKGNISLFAAVLFISLIFILLATLISNFIDNNNVITWQWVVSRFLDAGNFGGEDGHDIFELIITMLGVFFFSTLLVGACVSMVDSLTQSIHEGKRRYNLHDHILVLGSTKYLKVILNELREQKKAGIKIVVMSPEKQPFQQDFIYYNGCRYVESDLKSAHVDKAKQIFILGNDNEIGHDDKSLLCLKMLKELCSNADHDIYCKLLLQDQTSSEIFQYLKLSGGEKNANGKEQGWTATGKHLLVDVINENECHAEMLLLGKRDFLPTIKEQDNLRSHMVIMGFSPIAQAVAYTVAHVSHYPNFLRTGKKTCITFIGEGCKSWMENLIAARPGLFDLSSYTYMDSLGNKTVHTPNDKFGDFLDVEWQFIDAEETSQISTHILTEIAQNNEETMRVCTCHNNPSQALTAALHLPRIVYSRAKIAVFSNDEVDGVVGMARNSNMYGDITFFGDTDEIFEYSHSEHVARGQRVNFMYSKEYGQIKEGDTPESIWYSQPEVNKSSSIYSANFIEMRLKCFENNSDEDRMIIYEAEHRRWMMASLLMGYFAGPMDKKHFIHGDIVPFDQLSEIDKKKDQDLVDATPYIMGQVKAL